MSSWTCKKCTFINSPSAKPKPICKICLSPPSPPPFNPSSPSSSNQETPKWACKSCTFLNSYKNTTACEICGSFKSSIDDLNVISLDNDDLDSSVGSVFLPLRSCKRKIDSFDDVSDKGGSFRGVKACNGGVSNVEIGESDGGYVKLGGFQGFGAPNNKAVTVVKEDVTPPTESSSFKILSYNVWFQEDLELRKRMKALGDLIQLHSPDVICFQEVTPNIYDIFRQSSWWKEYRCSVTHHIANSIPYFCMQLSKLAVHSFSTRPFDNSIMGRELCIAELEVHHNKPLVVATSHLESPCPAPPTWDQMFSKERVYQVKEAINFLKSNPNVIFCGDMNWDDKLDGQFPLPDGWSDAWAELKPGDNGYTYDTKSNQMLSGNRTLQKRLDRFVFNLRDFKISAIDMIGKESIPGLTYIKEKKVKKEVKKLELPVLPSDHYGLLLTISDR